MSDTKNVAFRSAIGGYNREDVNQYILTINRELEEKALAAEESEKKIEAITEELDAAKADKDALEGIQASLRESVDQLKEENESLREKLAAAEAEKAQLAERLAEMEKSAEEEEKSQKYDRISAQIGDIMISANTSADAIVAAANTHAAKILSDTESEANTIRTRLNEQATEMLAHISGELHTSAESCMCELITALSEMRDNTAVLIQDFEKRSRDLSLKVEYYQTTLTETIRTALREMDKQNLLSPSGADSQ
ncbi:MAG: hypothetical protein IJZ08_00600 [Clostridia bacterium]|nr:hypothetical protein [Clostridia bacterium]